MNIIEAIESGKRFKLIGNDIWLDCFKHHYCLERKDILSDDWEIEEEKIKLSWEQIRSEICANFYDEKEKFKLAHIKKELGFKE